MNKIPNTSGNGFKLKRELPEEYSHVFHVDVVEEEEDDDDDEEPLFDDEPLNQPESDHGDVNVGEEEKVSSLYLFL